VRRATIEASSSRRRPGPGFFRETCREKTGSRPSPDDEAASERMSENSKNDNSGGSEPPVDENKLIAERRE
jgi:hypothetical protein